MFEPLVFWVEFFQFLDLSTVHCIRNYRGGRADGNLQRDTSTVRSGWPSGPCRGRVGQRSPRGFCLSTLSASAGYSGLIFEIPFQIAASFPPGIS